MTGLCEHGNEPSGYKMEGNHMTCKETIKFSKSISQHRMSESVNVLAPIYNFQV
jgi:hypothetical protein